MQLSSQAVVLHPLLVPRTPVSMCAPGGTRDWAWRVNKTCCTGTGHGVWRSHTNVGRAAIQRGGWGHSGKARLGSGAQRSLVAGRTEIPAWGHLVHTPSKSRIWGYCPPGPLHAMPLQPSNLQYLLSNSNSTDLLGACLYQFSFPISKL